MSATVIYANLGLSASALGAANYTTAVTAATTDARVYANGAVSAEQAAQTDTDFAAATMSNLGMTAAIIGQAAYDALLPAYAAYLASVGVANRGVVVVQLASIVAGLTADATFGAAATNLVNASNAALTYSSNAANTAALAIDVATVPAPVTSFSLTTSTTDNLVGSALADIFAGVTSGLASANTLDATDKVDGGAGDDKLNISLNTDFTGFSTGSVANVETIALANANASARSFNTKGIAGATSFEVNAGDQNFTLAGLSSIPSVKLNNQNGSTARDFVVEFAAASIPTGTADAISINLTDVGRAAVAATATAAAVTVQASKLNLNSIEVANVTTAGTTVDVAFANSASLKTINLAGTAATTVADTPATLTTFDASAATGAVTVALTTGGDAGRITSIKGGSAVDKITANIADLAANATIAGGAGADVLTLAGTAGGTKQYVMSGVETVTFAGVTTNALTFSGAKAIDLTTVTSTSAATTGITLVGMGAADLEIKATGSSTVANTATHENGDISSDSTGNVTVSYSAGAVTLAAATTADAPAADYTLTAMTGALTVNVGSMVSTASTTIAADKATSLVINTTSGTTTASTPVELTSLSGQIDAAKATSVVINSAGLIGASGTPYAVNANSATTATINQGSSAAYLDLNTAKLATLNVNAGSTFDLTGSDFSALQVVTADVAKNTLTIPNIATASSVTVSGAGATATLLSKVSLGSLGQNTNTYGLSLTASGLKGGLVATTVRGGDGYTTNIDVSKVSAATATTLAVDIGNIGAAAAGAVSINAAGVVGAVKLGTVDSVAGITVTANPTKSFQIGTVTSASNAGDVTVNLDGTVGLVTVGEFHGNNVTVKASDTIGGVTNGATANKFVISAKTSANVEVSSLQAGVVEITSSSTSSGLAVALKGGSFDDTVTVTGVAGSTSLALTGDLGLGTDKVTVNGGAYSGAATQTISLANLAGYETSTLIGSNGKDVIVGGAGADRIAGGNGQDTLTGGAGADMFYFTKGSSTSSAPDVITDFSAGTSGDRITTDATTAVTTVTSGTGLTISNGVVTFTATQASLTAAATTVSNAVTTDGNMALFSHGGKTYAFIADGSAGLATTDIVVELTGVVLPTTALSNAADSVTLYTGLSGFGI